MDFGAIPLYLGVDAIFFSICLRNYLLSKWAVDAIKKAPVLEINSKLDEFVQSQPDHKVPYCTIRGTIRSLTTPIQSLNALDITGVVQKLVSYVKLKESTHGSCDTCQDPPLNLMKDITTKVEFGIHSGQSKVEVLRVLEAKFLALDVIADQIDPKRSGERLYGILYGTNPEGHFTTEEMLREGTLMTGIGELILDKASNTLQIRPPSDGTSFYLTSLPLSSVVQRLDEDKSFHGKTAIFLGGIAVVLTFMMARHWWTRRVLKLAEESKQKRLDMTRKDRRRSVRDRNLPMHQRCVVCQDNPREIIVLPCGHVCLCEDCEDSKIMIAVCPVCRAKIQATAPAYLP